MTFINLGKECIRRLESVLTIPDTHMTQNSSRETSNDTRTKSDTELRSIGQIGFGVGGHLLVDELGCTFVHGELTFRLAIF